MRGAGDLIGTAQSGLPRFRIADLERQAIPLMALAQGCARACWPATRARSPRGQAARMTLGLLWLMEQDAPITGHATAAAIHPDARRFFFWGCAGVIRWPIAVDRPDAIRPSAVPRW
jgi:hypothetical protein